MIDVEGDLTWTAHDRSRIKRLRINGKEQIASPDSTTSPTDASVAYTVDFTRQHHKVTLASATTTAFNFSAQSNFIEGGRVLVEIHNNTGNSFTPTGVASVFKLQNGLAFSALATGNVMMVELLGLKRVAGANRGLVTGIWIAS